MSRHPVTALTRAVSALAEAAGMSIDIVSATARDWTSATFVGAEHRLELASPSSPTLDDWLAALPEVEMSLPGHVVADMQVVRTDPAGFTLSVLTLVA